MKIVVRKQSGKHANCSPYGSSAFLSDEATMMDNAEQQSLNQSMTSIYSRVQSEGTVLAVSINDNEFGRNPLTLEELMDSNERVPARRGLLEIPVPNTSRTIEFWGPQLQRIIPIMYLLSGKNKRGRPCKPLGSIQVMHRLAHKQNQLTRPMENRFKKVAKQNDKVFTRIVKQVKLQNYSNSKIQI
jgi:hypothetical protein